MNKNKERSKEVRYRCGTKMTTEEAIAFDVAETQRRAERDTRRTGGSEWKAEEHE